MKRPFLWVASLGYLPPWVVASIRPGLVGSIPAGAGNRARAPWYDPYPENEPGPAMVGVRPREYQKPPPEPSRAPVGNSAIGDSEGNGRVASGWRPGDGSWRSVIRFTLPLPPSAFPLPALPLIPSLFPRTPSNILTKFPTKENRSSVQPHPESHCAG